MVCTEHLIVGDEEENCFAKLIFSFLKYGENLADFSLSAMMEGRRPELARMLV